MPRYRIRAIRWDVSGATYDVDAEDEHEARELARDPEYDHLFNLEDPGEIDVESVELIDEE